ncbi:hypothetical protein Rsub_04740 [Raphidocelis subcapitata]|uniref:Uncharacterized protein n=1 Tax=Raphidocelis subcapitata TaxID=307507 RepID=A0A2V0NWL7_9CHLO|nr:hypothetical protein Rsub_04740 [Raphidocelis subcapitata]|eukprot:GBF92016.1 hypothetical protein Rsub_04740 [Raphidocelis subcapitata]
MKTAAAAAAALSAHLSPVLEFVAALACRGEGGGGGGSGAAGGLTPIVAVVLSPLDGSDAAMPDERQWTWAVEQVQMDQEQEELVTALLELWRERNAALNARRAQLLATVEAHARSEAAAHESVLRALSESQTEFEVHAIVIFLGLYGSLLSPVQVGTLLVSSWPFAPTLHMLHAVLAARRDAPGGGAEAAAQAGDGTGGSGDGGGGGGGGSGGSGGPGRGRRGRASI